jgi:hypothetical protein
MSLKSKQRDFLNKDRGNKYGYSDKDLQSLSVDNLMDGTLTTIFRSIVNELKKNLRESGANTNREQLLQSITFQIQEGSGSIHCQLSLEDHYPFVDMGVQGFYSTKDEETEKSPYKFRSPFPGYKMMNALKRWITEKPVFLKYNRDQPRTRKKLKEAADARRKLAWAIASKVKQDGTTATKFYSSVINDTTISRIEKDLADQLGRYIKVSLVEPE